MVPCCRLCSSRQHTQQVSSPAHQPHFAALPVDSYPAANLVASASRSPRNRRQRQQQHWDHLIASAVPALLPAALPEQHKSLDVKVLLDVMADLPQQHLHHNAAPFSTAAAAAAAAESPPHSTPSSSPLKHQRQGKGALKFESKQEEQVGCRVCLSAQHVTFDPGHQPIVGVSNSVENTVASECDV